MHNANIWSSIILILSVEVTLKGPVDPRNGMVMNLTVLCLKMKVWVLKSTASCLQVYSKCAEICAYPWQAYPTTAGRRPIGLGLTLMWIELAYFRADMGVSRFCVCLTPFIYLAARWSLFIDCQFILKLHSPFVSYLWKHASLESHHV